MSPAAQPSEDLLGALRAAGDIAYIWDIASDALEMHGDLDALSNEVGWAENRLNEPSADFGPQQVISNLANSANSVFAADIDGDGVAVVVESDAAGEEDLDFLWGAELEEAGVLEKEWALLGEEQ